MWPEAAKSQRSGNSNSRDATPKRAEGNQGGALRESNSSGFQNITWRRGGLEGPGVLKTTLWVAGGRCGLDRVPGPMFSSPFPRVMEWKGAKQNKSNPSFGTLAYLTSPGRCLQEKQLSACPLAQFTELWLCCRIWPSQALGGGGGRTWWPARSAWHGTSCPFLESASGIPVGVAGCHPPSQ